MDDKLKVLGVVKEENELGQEEIHIDHYDDLLEEAADNSREYYLGATYYLNELK